MSWSDVTPSLVPSLTFIGGGLMTFIAHRLLDKHRTADRVPSLEAENRRLETLLSELKLECFALQDALRPYTDRDLIRDGLQRHDQTNTLVDPTTGTHYCIPCLETTPPIKMSLSRSATGFRCPSCKTQFTNTSIPRPILADMAARARNR
jgi:hypothetical protein